MLARDLRPRNLSAVVGQDSVLRVLKAIIKDPDKSPRSLIFAGSFGSGKTTCARVLAKELNGVKEDDYDFNSSPFYYEYDATVIGNVETVRSLRETLGSSYLDYWKVVVFDESHATSTQAQTALLKVLEDVSGKVMFVFCTTHVEKILPTIRSRSLELQFTTISVDKIVSHLGEVEKTLNIIIPDDIKMTIANRSGGHMRDVHMLLDNLLLVGEDSFRSTIKSSVDLYTDFFIACYNDDKDNIKEVLNNMLECPLTHLNKDFSEFIYLVLNAHVMGESRPKIDDLLAIYKDGIMKVINIYFSDWIKNIFISSYDFYAGMLAVYHLVRKSVVVADTSQQSRTRIR